MARYQEIADDLQHQIVDQRRYPIGTRLPSIAELMDTYEVPGLNTIRQAQQVLIQKGLLEARQGVGVFVVATSVSEQIDVLAELRQLRATVDRLIEHVERHPREFDA
ncbi:GntR family transcriptional regulator [Geodermatophilus sp. SYSU D00766]